ncbi:MAG: terminase family protein [Deltaproteobacteria bacterium]|nr:terminase family protein [Deltaproteobacteria bacterium]MBW2081679.1 terminase family protein [Deltaproteobacteria bacterium]MBW2298874.1 terminase family protein [Deltaproteobacteria bacterium]
MDLPEPIVKLYPYQKRWILDESRFLAGMWARQTGKSFGSAAKIVLDCREHDKATWVTISSGERQVKELMSKVKFHGELTGMAISWAEERYSYELPSGERDEYKVVEARFRNESRILGIPANPDTARGYTANVYLDEFSVHKASRELWAAVFPVISREGLRLMVTFTPKGKQNKAYEVWQNDIFTKHRVDIYQAVEQGCPHDIELLRAAIDDPDLWAQEYELVFLDEATAWLPYELLNECEHDRAGDPAIAGTGPFYVGMDIGRRRDLTVIWVIEQVGDVFWTREVVELRKASFSEQDQELDRVMAQYNPVRVCMDQTGMGEKPVEDAKRRHGDYKVEGVLFTGPVKLDLATGIRRKFEDRQIRIPRDRKVRDDLHSVKKVTTSSGNIRFDAERSGDSHADRFWTLALALHAAGASTEPRIRFLEAA